MKENNLEIIIKEDIKSMIYEVRGKQVMLDSDLAQLYRTANGTKDINKGVKRNLNRFPKDFYFQLTLKEFQSLNSQLQFGTTKNEQNESLRFQNGTLEKESLKGKHRKFLPYVFTEQGIAMLSSVLKTDIADTISIKIMRTFVAMRNFLTNNTHVFERLTTLEYKQLENEENFNILFDSFQKDEQWKHKILFAGQFYDAHSLLIDIIKEAKKSILIIDNYIDKTILDLLAKKNKNVESEIFTLGNKYLSNNDINKFNKQYPRLKVRYTNNFHDRFIIIDNEDLYYHVGASLKDLGNKCFGINKIEDEKLIEYLKNSTRFLPLSSYAKEGEI